MAQVVECAHKTLKKAPEEDRGQNRRKSTLIIDLPCFDDILAFKLIFVWGWLEASHQCIS